MGTGIKKLKLHTLAVLILFLVVAPSMFADPKTALFEEEKSNIKIQFFSFDLWTDPVANLLSVSTSYRFNLKQKFAGLAIHPIRVVVTNNGNLPIEISGRSLKTKLASDDAISQLVVPNNDGTIGIVFVAFTYGGMFLLRGEEGTNRGVGGPWFKKYWRSLIGFPLLITTQLLFLYLLAKIVESKVAKRIKQFMLNEPVRIEAGKTATKVIFFNTSSYSPFFDFFVLNPIDKNSYAAIFNVALN